MIASARHFTTSAAPEQALQAVTGLPMQRIARGQDPLTAADLAQLPDDARALLAPHLGTAVCGLARVLGLTATEDDSYQPSAAFVAQQAACLVVGALIARTTRTSTDGMRNTQYDALFGPGQPDMVIERRPRPGCTCQIDRHLITQVRAHRANLLGELSRHRPST